MTWLCLLLLFSQATSCWQLRELSLGSFALQRLILTNCTSLSTVHLAAAMPADVAAQQEHPQQGRAVDRAVQGEGEGDVGARQQPRKGVLRLRGCNALRPGDRAALAALVGLLGNRA